MAYQDGFYGAADLYVSTILSTPHNHSFYVSLLSLGFQVWDGTGQTQSGAAMNGVHYIGWNAMFIKVTSVVPISKLPFMFRPLTGVSLCFLWVCANVIICVCERAHAGDHVDNSLFCSLCRLVFQDISGSLPQVGFTHSVWEPVCILLVSNDCVLLDVIDHLRSKCLLSSFTNSLDSDMSGVAEGVENTLV